MIGKNAQTEVEEQLKDKVNCFQFVFPLELRNHLLEPVIHTRTIVSFIANADGYDKLQRFFTGRAKTTAVFKHDGGKAVEISSQVKRGAWMTGSDFRNTLSMLAKL